MSKPIHPIAKVTAISGFNGDVRLKPLSRYFDEYIDGVGLTIGFNPENSKSVSIQFVTGQGKRRRFKFHGINTQKTAKDIVGKTVYVKTSNDANINMISKNLIDYKVVNELGDFIGNLIDVMWLPNNDAYIINNGEKELLIPIIPEVIKCLDHKEQKIIITMMDGLLD